MAQKDYTKGLARRCWDIQRYITRYGMTTPIAGNTAWTTTLQGDAASIQTAAQAIANAIAFREQP